MLARWVIHVVGPIYTTTEDRAPLLASCYREALRVADELDVKTLAIPAVSAGVYGWPIESAAQIALDTVRSASSNLEHVRFVLFSDAAYDAFDRALRT